MRSIVVATVFVLGCAAATRLPAQMPTNPPFSARAELTRQSLLGGGTNAQVHVKELPPVFDFGTGTVSRADLERGLREVVAQLEAVGKEEAEMKSRRSADRDSLTALTSNVSTQDAEVVRIRKRLEEIEVESTALRVQLQKKVEALPSYRDIEARNREYAEKWLNLTQRRSALLKEKTRIASELWRQNKVEAEKRAPQNNAEAAGQGTNVAPAVHGPGAAL